MTVDGRKKQRRNKPWHQKATSKFLAELPEPLTLLTVEGGRSDAAAGWVAAHSPQLVWAVVLSPLRCRGCGGMQLR